jgi:hypothetical protein
LTTVGLTAFAGFAGMVAVGRRVAEHGGDLGGGETGISQSGGGASEVGEQVEPSCWWTWLSLSVWWFVLQWWDV